MQSLSLLTPLRAGLPNFQQEVTSEGSGALVLLSVRILLIIKVLKAHMAQEELDMGLPQTPHFVNPLLLGLCFFSFSLRK